MNSKVDFQLFSKDEEYLNDTISIMVDKLHDLLSSGFYDDARNIASKIKELDKLRN
jgi:hypothetical protein